VHLLEQTDSGAHTGQLGHITLITQISTIPIISMSNNFKKTYFKDLVKNQNQKLKLKVKAKSIAEKITVVFEFS
jgi:hypothetical protein